MSVNIRSFLFNTYTHIRMRLSPKTIVGISTVSFCLVLGAAVGFVRAGADEVTKIKDRITQLQTEMARNSVEFDGLSASIGEDRAHCDLAAAKEAQMSRLNGSNNAKRTEIEVLESLLTKDDAAINLGK